MKITKKLTFGFVGVALLVGVVVAIALYYQNKIIESYILHEINDTVKTFRDLKKHEERILSSALEVFIQEQAFKDVFLEKDREKLYNYGQPLFGNLKHKYGITHFYFILPDEHCFVRLHNKEVYGDLITRFTFYKARDTKKAASGIELGKTAFALRIVMPYYNNNELIGYVEFGEEIDHFLEILKGDTNNEFGLIAGKKYLDREKWKSVKQVAGLRDNWDDLEDHVTVGDTTKGKTKEIITKYFTEENLELVEEEGTFFQQIQAEEKTFAFGGFEIIDAGGRHAGSVLCLIDMTEQMGIAQKSYFATFGIATTILIIALGGGSFFARSISRPIIKLENAAVEIGKGNVGIKVEIKSKDEIGILADSFNKMTEDLQNRIDDLNREVLERKQAEKQLQKKTSELSKAQEATLSMAEDIERDITERKQAEERLKAANQQLEANEEQLKQNINELERFNRLAVERELRMVELKQQVNALLCELGREEEYQNVSEITENCSEGNLHEK